MKKTSIIRFFCFFLFPIFSLGLVLFVQGVSALDNSPATLPLCTCYYATEKCPNEGEECAVSNDYCQKDGKKDGKCRKLPAPSGFPVQPQSLVQAVSLYFDAYLLPISEGEGRPSVEILTEADGVSGLTEVQREEVRNAVHNALDALIGFDFQYPQGPPFNAGNGRGVARFGNIRGTPDGATAIAMAARTAMVDAILTRNLNYIAGPLEDFWATYPDFHPNHTGRVYPHGHADYEEKIGTPLAGQISTLRLILLNHLLNDGAPLCGNDVREAFEECDGTDDSVCPAVCSADCTCGFIP